MSLQHFAILPLENVDFISAQPLKIQFSGGELSNLGGLDVARQLGRKGGRKRQMTDSKIVSAKKLLVSGVPLKDVAKNLGVSLPTLYRWVPASAHA